mmetsp:Transcript_43691/g.121434  ORF Transcript_43691/g.121434 Transcript_43691/m.121434 type:complete len:218 (+) Transcript_43691:1169-1822(+)
MATTVPLKSPKKRSSQATLSASRWLVGSSSRRMSGSERSKRQIATRRRSPPLSVATLASRGGQRSASMAWSSFLSSSQPLQASKVDCSVSIRASNVSMSASGSAICMLISLNSSSMSFVRCRAGSKFSMTVSASSTGSCSRWPIRTEGSTWSSPSKSLSLPARMRMTVLLPAPFEPRMPIFAPMYMPRQTSLRMAFPSGAFLSTLSSARIMSRVSCA